MTGKVPDIPHWPARTAPALADHYIRALAISLACYALLGRGFAYVGMPPLFVGEALYCLGLMVLLRSGCIIGVFAAFPNLVLLAFAAWTLARTLPFLPVYGMDALRDAVIVLYGGFTLIVCGLLMERPERLHRGLRLFGRFAAFFGAAAGIAFSVQTLLGNHGLLPSWPTSGVPLLSMKPGDVAVHLAGSAVFALLFFRRIIWPWVALLLAGMAMVGVGNRGGLLAIASAVGIALPFSGRIRQLSGIVLAGGVVLAAAWLLDLNVHLTERERPLSVEQLFINLFSIFDESEHGDLDGTKAWRLRWWQTIADYTLHGEYFWSGKGFGIGLAAADGFGGVTPPGAPELRSPHNINMTILARAGVPGLVLWTLLLLSWFGTMAYNLVVARIRSEEAWFRLFLFVACYVAAVLINASFDVALEGPMLGIWFWVLIGFGLGAAQIYRTQRAVFATGSRSPLARPRRVLLAASAPTTSRSAS